MAASIFQLVFYIIKKYKESFCMNNVNTRRIAFFDAEFTADTAKDRGIQEMIQCALVVHEIQITDERFLISMTEEPIHAYNTFVKPRYTKRLSKYIRDLTGIKQSDVNGGKDFDDVISDICDIINNYFTQTMHPFLFSFFLLVIFLNTLA